MTTVLLSGGGTHNVGAYLLSMAAASAARQHMGADRIAVPLAQGSLVTALGPDGGRCRWLRGNRWNGRPFPRVAVNTWRVPVDAEIEPRDVDVVIDVSGFAYGAPWPARTGRRLARDLRYWHRRGARYVLAPQSYGPLGAIGPAARRTLAEELPRALVFAREASGVEHLRAVAPMADVVLADDIVLLWPVEQLRRVVGLDQRRATHRGLVVPNQMVVESGAAPVDEHVRTCVAVAEEMRSRELEPVVLVAATQDVDLAREIATRAGVEMVRPPSMADTVAEVAGADLVWSSRYHCSLIALKMARPVVSVGWSVKYRALHELFSSPTCFAPADVLGAPQVAAACDASRAPVVEPTTLVERHGALWAQVAEFAVGRQPAPAGERRLHG